MATTLVLVSDTHGSHRELIVPEGDILVHAGDATASGSIAEVAEFGRWLVELPHRHKIFVAGNHDWAFERHPQRARALLPSDVHYLLDREVTAHGLRIWGSPWQPEFNDWAFNLPRGARLAERWALIPEGIDVLVTHGPPAGIGDRTVEGEHTGCADLLARVRRLGPRLHVFGHIHEARGGPWSIGGTLFVNASVAGATGAVVVSLGLGSDLEQPRRRRAR